MPTYEYRCSTCDDTFELSRPMAESSAPAKCASGHKAHRVLSAFAAVTSGGGSAPAPSTASAAPCGAACACH